MQDKDESGRVRVNALLVESVASCPKSAQQQRFPLLFCLTS